MRRWSLEIAGWTLTLAAAIAVLLLARAAIAFPLTVLVAALWSMKVDREEQAVQLLDPDGPASNRYPTHGSVRT
jgi:hypothetical protein